MQYDKSLSLIILYYKYFSPVVSESFQTSNLLFSPLWYDKPNESSRKDTLHKCNFVETQQKYAIESDIGGILIA